MGGVVYGLAVLGNRGEGSQLVPKLSSQEKIGTIDAPPEMGMHLGSTSFLG